MIPNKKLNADAAYMFLYVFCGEKKIPPWMNLWMITKQYYYDWHVLKRKLKVLSEEKILDFMIKNAEIKIQKRTWKDR